MTQMLARAFLVVSLALLLLGVVAAALSPAAAAQPLNQPPRPTLTPSPAPTGIAPTATPPPEPPPVVPEASTLLLLGSALVGMGGYVALQVRARRRG